MTAIVGVLNKHAVALAADSAVTIGGRKVMNSANKIFTLSKHHPVAIAVYGNSELIGTPWEIIIKEFRKSIGNTSKPYLEDYVECFFDFLKSKDYYVTNSEADIHIKASVNTFLNSLIQSKSPAEVETFIRRIYEKIKDPLLPNLEKEDEEYFKSLISDIIDPIKVTMSAKGINLTVDDVEKALKALYLCSIPQFGKTGLIFTGYGESEYFPVLINCEVGIVINSKLTISKATTVSISKENSSSICPFAQTDVMNTILDGISPQVHDLYTNTLGLALDKVIDSLSKLIEPNDAVLAKQIANIDMSPIKTTFIQLSTQSRMQSYTAPFVASVAGLEKDDLADFAESLIKLTSIKRKVSMEQDSVGGPTDVMLISKGDGAIWKRRKHYFDKELNHHFFKTYFD